MGERIGCSSRRLLSLTVGHGKYQCDAGIDARASKKLKNFLLCFAGVHLWSSDIQVVMLIMHCTSIVTLEGEAIPFALPLLQMETFLSKSTKSLKIIKMQH